MRTQVSRMFSQSRSAPSPTLILLLAGLFLCTLPFDAAGAVTVEDGKYRVTLKGAEETEAGKNRFRFEIEELPEGKVSSFTLENLTSQVRDLGLHRDKLVVYGAVENQAAGVTIVDLPHRREVDFLLCYHPQPSTTGRYVIYRKFYPRFAPRETQSDLVLLYDLTRTPRENRLGADRAAAGVELRPGSPEHLLAAKRVGYPLYPLSSAERKDYRVWVEAADERHSVSGGFLWLDQDSRVLFLDRQTGEEWVVIVDLSSGPEHPKVARLALAEANFQSVGSPTSPGEGGD